MVLVRVAYYEKLTTVFFYSIKMDTADLHTVAYVNNKTLKLHAFTQTDVHSCQE